MKNTLTITVLSLATASLAFAADAQLKDDKDKVSYCIGYDIGSTLKRQSIEVDQNILQQGMKDAIADTKPLMTEEQRKEVMTNFQKQMIEKQNAKRKEMSEKNKAAGQAFLDANKTKPGVKATASGLQYKMEKEGTGPTPKETDTVKVNYRGTTIDGKEFDSSYKRNMPATFPVNRVIKGWTEGLQLMKVGSKYQFFIPSDLAYGERGAGSQIEPNSVLIFDVELLSIEKPTEASPNPAGPGGAIKFSPPPTARTGATPMTQPTASTRPKEP